MTRPPDQLPQSAHDREWSTAVTRGDTSSTPGRTGYARRVPPTQAPAGRGATATGFVPIADAAGFVDQDTNPGFPGSAQISVVTLPADAPAIAVKLAGDAFPRLVIMADSANGIYLGNGADSLSTTFANISMDSNGLLSVGVAGFAPGIRLVGGDVEVASGDVRFNTSGIGPVVTDSVTGTRYRVGMASGVPTYTVV